MEQDKSERLVVISYVNIQEIMGLYNQSIEYKFNDLLLKGVVNKSSPKYVLLTSNLKSTKYSFLIAIKAELIAMESVENNSDENSMVLKLRIIEVVRIHIDTIRYLDEKIAMANYLIMCSPDFASIKDDVAKLILSIRYIEDEHMPKLPTFDSELNIESLEQYSYRLNCFIVTVVSKVVKVDNLEDFFNGHVLTILKKAKCILLQYLEIKAKEEQVEQDTIFQEKISFGQILPLIPLDSTNQVKLIPLMQSCDNVYISNFVKNQLIKCTKILQGKRCYVALIPEFDVKSQEDIGKKHLGVLASLHSIFIPSSIESYALPTAKIIPEKTVMVSVVQKQEHQGEYGEQKYTFYCEVEDLEYEVNDRGKLQSLIINCLDIFRKYKDSEYYLPHYTKELGDNINYIAKLSTYIIYYLYLNNRIKGCVDLLATKNLEKRFETIELILLQFLCNQKKGAKYSFFSKANEFIKEVSEIPKGFSLVLFYGEVEKYLSLSTFEEHNKCGLSILDSEQIERNYYNNDKTVLLVRESLGDFDPKSIVPSVLARVNNILIKENNKANIYLSPEKRVRVTEIVEKDGVFYGSAKEIVEPKPKSREELDKLKQLVEKLIKVYQRKDYQGSRKYSDSRIPIFNSALVNFETYAANLSFYIADNIFGYNYNSHFDKNVSREFCSKSTIEKLTYLIEYIEPSKKTSNLTTPSTTDIDTSNCTTSEQWLELGKSMLDTKEAIKHFNRATQLYPNNAEIWYFKGKALERIKKYQEGEKCFEKALSLNLCDIYRKEIFKVLYLKFYCSQEYEKALRYNNELSKLEKPGFNLGIQARIYCKLNKYQEALKCCNEIAELDSDDVVKGDVLYALGRLEEAVESYSQVIAYYSKNYDEDAIYSSTCTKVHLHRGIVLDALGKREAATKEYKKVIQRLDFLIAIFEYPSPDKYFLKAIAYSKLGKLKEASECYDKMSGSMYYLLINDNYKLLKSYYALLDFSDHKNVYPIKADINAILQDYPKQMECYKKILELDPHNKSALCNLWLLCDKIGKTEEAVNYLEKIIKLVDDNPNKFRLYSNIGKVLCKLHKYQESLDYFNKALAIDLSNTDIICTVNTLSHYANTLSLLGRYKESIEYFDKALSLDSYHTFSYLNKARVLSQLGKYCESLGCCIEGLSINPDDHDFLVVRSKALYGECKRSLTENMEYLECLIENIPLSQEAKNIAIKELNIIKSLSDNSDEKTKHRKYLHNLLKLPWEQYDDVYIDLKKAARILDQEHYGLEEVKNRILESLVFMTRSNLAKAPIICLVGPPGVGKTSIARSIANALGRKFVSLSLAGGRDTSLIRGFMHTYTDSHPGKILSLMTEAGTSNPVMVLDEIDKMDGSRGNGLESALLQLLDPEQNNRFTDDYFDFPFDLSKVFFITTANSLEQISYPLINRMEIIELSGYTDYEKSQISNNYLLPKILKEANLIDKKLEIDDTIIKYLIKHYTKESGVRDIERTLRMLIQKYLVDEIKGSKPIVNQALIEQYLGTAKYQHTTLDKTAKVGMAIGLAYTASGGSVMTIEAEKFPGEGKIKATGKLGEVLQESVEAALAYLKANAEELGINQQLFKKYDLHLHLPEGAIAKDGPSAGITIYVALASLLSGKKVRQDIAMTGELTLKGRVLPIGGLKEKLSAAVRENITTVIIPEGNKRDLAKISHEIKGVLTIKTISHASELLNVVFINKK